MRLRTRESANALPAEERVDHDALLRRAQLGDVAAFESIYRSHAAAVYALGRRMLIDETEARELTQDTFVRVWERLTQFRGQSELATWIHRIAVNIALNRLRSTKRDAARLLDEDVDAWANDVRRADVDVHTRLDVDAAIARLPDGARTVFLLYDVEGYSHDEIAQMTGMAPGTARAQLWRARRALMRMLDL